MAGAKDIERLRILEFVERETNKTDSSLTHLNILPKLKSWFEGKLDNVSLTEDAFHTWWRSSRSDRGCSQSRRGSRAGIIGVYQRHDFAAEKRAALEAWAEHVMAVAVGREAVGLVEIIPANEG